MRTHDIDDDEQDARDSVRLPSRYACSDGISRALTVKKLKEYNEWRRGGDGPQPNPTTLGKTIEDAIKLILTK